MAERGTIQKIAEETGVNQATVRRALKASGLNAGRGGFELAKAVEIVKANADPARIAGHAANGRGEGGGTDTISTLADARARAEGFRARKLELENLKAEGRLVDRATVSETIATVISAARTECLALGIRCAPRLVGASDQKEIARVIDAEIRRILEDLSNHLAVLERQEQDALS